MCCVCEFVMISCVSTMVVVCSVFLLYNYNLIIILLSRVFHIVYACLRTLGGRVCCPESMQFIANICFILLLFAEDDTPCVIVLYVIGMSVVISYVNPAINYVVCY